ncbi:MAG: FKBP-type peptidyl-prolyl cis-trans isomerase [Bacteroidales bacterium]|nr:FKBP-type peptidyl-prolyl cis-trans isomerase [Bacteroidales bacterium]
MKKNTLLLAISLCVLLFSCGNKETGIVHVQQSDKQEKEDPYLKWNQVNVEREDEDIDFFLRRYGWEMQKTGTGLRYQCVKEGQGNRPLPEQTVTVKYTTVLLTGDTVYSSDRDGLKRFKVDKSDEMAGLNEAVKMMRKGERARLVIPSFLAYGVAGDGDRIRGKVTLAMYVELIDIQ